MNSTTPVNNPPWNRQHTAWERYRDDAQFHCLVDTIWACLMRAEFTPSEVRQAAILACIQHENCRIKTLRISPLDAEAIGHLKAFDEWLEKA